MYVRVDKLKTSITAIHKMHFYVGRLSRRLKALSTTKFGSTESGLNRIASSVPNTNKHAIEGSNPVFGESDGQDFDAARYVVKEGIHTQGI